jgi:hypothetical protein
VLTAGNHLQQAQHNVQAAWSLHQAGFYDWAITAAFYAAEHYAQHFIAIAEEDGYRPSRVIDRSRGGHGELRFRFAEVETHRRLQRDAEGFHASARLKSLYVESSWARYGPSNSGGDLPANPIPPGVSPCKHLTSVDSERELRSLRSFVMSLGQEDPLAGIMA